MATCLAVLLKASLSCLLLTPANAWQVARCIVSGAARGDYHIRGPDVGLNILVASMAGFSPRVYNWCFEIVLAPLLVLLAKLAVPLADRIVRKHRAAEGGS